MKFAWLVFLDIAQDCSLGQYLPSNKGENSQAQIKAKMIFTVLMLQSVQSNLPILSCTKSHHPSCWFERRPQSEVFNWVFLEYWEFGFLSEYRCLQVHCQFRSSRPKVVCKKGVLRNFAKFTGKHLYQSVFFNKVANLSLQLY